jgi:hypothetical protein
MDTNVFNAVFWSFFITSVIGCLLKLTSMAYKSKCKEVDICCIKIIRDTDLEEKENEFEITHRTIPTNESNNNLPNNI